jgi:peptide/nickel transport system substrate-binding protein
MNGVSRREFLKLGTGAVMLGAGGSALAACGSSTTSTTTTTGTTPPHTIPRGGTLQVALTGGDASDTVDGQKGVDNVDFARIVSLYDALVVWDLDCTPRYTLAETIEPNKDATVWTIKLRKGVEFHNGKPLTAADVIYSYQRVVAGDLGGASSLASCDVKNMKAVDSLTVQIPCHVPFATFVTSIIGYYYYLSILPVGFDAKHPVGTGPFMFESFTPGEQSVFTRNPNYWDAPYPYIDKLVITDYATESSQVSSLLSGQADCVNLLSVASIKTVESGGANILVSKSAGMTPVTMRVDTAPFNDVNVRQALRLCVDREEMLRLIFGGYGRLGNDIFSPLDPEYDTSIPQRVQDIDQAKHLLKKANQENLTVTMQSSGVAQGTTELAQVLKQQASAAGITINIEPVTVTAFYGTNYLKWTFALDYWYYADYLPQVSEATLYNSPFNETHFASNPNTGESLTPPNNPQPPGGIGAKYISLYNEATATLDDAKRAELAHEMQMIDYNYGGYIIPYFPPVIDGYSKRVGGVVECLTGLSLSNYGFQRMYLTST